MMKTLDELPKENFETSDESQLTYISGKKSIE